ncbi:MAG: tetratricopeptide repeat protein [Planctomycetes bacterium]|nr:tetratricopeptide repeat protein [Planctomycetota bacterium]
MPKPDPTAKPNTSDAVERLYVFWLAGTLLLFVILIVTIFFMRGALHRQTMTINQQTEAISALATRLAKLEHALADKASLPQARTAAPGATPPPKPSNDPQPSQRPETTTAAPRLDRETVDTLLNKALKSGDVLPFALADFAAATALLEQVRDAGATADLSGPTWERLAIVAQLLNKSATAEGWAEQARLLNHSPRHYYELSARTLLAQGQPESALRFAQMLFDSASSAPPTDAGARTLATAQLLLAEVYLARDRLDKAAAVIDGMAAPAALFPADQLRFGQICVALERWNDLEQTLAALGSPPPELIMSRDFLRAVWLTHAGQLAEAVAILDYLAEECPEDYDVQTWRGVALLKAQQFAAAQQTLDRAAQQTPARPEAWYWRAMLEIKTGRPAGAVDFLSNALAASARYAPAWEALGTLALNRGDVDAALESLQNAEKHMPGRAPTQFLIAVAHAKASRRDEAAQALRLAIQLDEAYLETARQTPVLQRLFDARTLDDFLPTAPTTQPVQDQPKEAATEKRQ